MQNDDGDVGGAQPGPKPERLKLPHEDWKEAVREAVEDECSADGEDEGTELDDAETSDGE